MVTRSTALVFSAFFVFAAGSSVAQPVDGDPFYQDQVVEVNIGTFAPYNTLQDTLTTPNGGGAEIQRTDALDFGSGARLGVGYSQTWGENARLRFSFNRASAMGSELITIGSTNETFPGSYDDGFVLPANWSTEIEIETRSEMFMLGREWALERGWHVSGGLQAGRVSQDLTGTLFDLDGNVDRIVITDSNNVMVGVFGGTSYYATIGDKMGLRFSADLGVLKNDFTYDYVNIVNSDEPISQFISGSESGELASLQVTARLERRVRDNGMLSFEVGYEGLKGLGNGVDTFLDAEGTTTTSPFEKDMIGAAYISLGYAFLF